jgi:hypothetical protein
MEQMLERLLANMDADKRELMAKIDADKQELMAKMDATQHKMEAKMDANLEIMKEQMKNMQDKSVDIQDEMMIVKAESTLMMTEMETTIKSSQEETKTAINSIRSELEEKIKTRMEKALAAADQQTRDLRKELNEEIKGTRQHLQDIIHKVGVTVNSSNPVCEHKQDLQKRQKERNGTDYIKTNEISMKAKQKPVKAASGSFTLPPTYQRGAIPKYLLKRREARQNEAIPRDLACPLGHVTIEDSDKEEPS